MHDTAKYRDAIDERHAGPLTVIRQWQDEPELGRSADDFPYPDIHIRSRANGELADRIRLALGARDGRTVMVEELEVSGGYSEYTQENDYTIKVACDGETWESRKDYSASGAFAQLMRWLDEKAPVDDEGAKLPELDAVAQQVLALSRDYDKTAVTAEHYSEVGDALEQHGYQRAARFARALAAAFRTV